MTLKPPTRLITRRFRVEVAFHHVDMMRVVHNVQYLQWFEIGRLQVVEEVVPLADALREKLALPVVLNHAQYLSPATYRDRLVVTTTHRVLPAWEGKFLFNHSISNEKNKETLCIGYSEVTVLDLSSKRVLKKIPDDIWARYRSLT